MKRFTLRDLFWLTLVVALAYGWWSDHKQLKVVVGNLYGRLYASDEVARESIRAFNRLHKRVSTLMGTDDREDLVPIVAPPVPIVIEPSAAPVAKRTPPRAPASPNKRVSRPPSGKPASPGIPRDRN